MINLIDNLKMFYRCYHYIMTLSGITWHYLTWFANILKIFYTQYI